MTLHEQLILHTAHLVESSHQAMLEVRRSIARSLATMQDTQRAVTCSQRRLDVRRDGRRSALLPSPVCSGRRKFSFS
jgi:hypothetical protein